MVWDFFFLNLKWSSKNNLGQSFPCKVGRNGDCDKSKSVLKAKHWFKKQTKHQDKKNRLFSSLGTWINLESTTVENAATNQQDSHNIPQGWLHVEQKYESMPREQRGQHSTCPQKSSQPCCKSQRCAERRISDRSNHRVEAPYSGWQGRIRSTL